MINTMVLCYSGTPKIQFLCLLPKKVLIIESYQRAFISISKCDSIGDPATIVPKFSSPLNPPMVDFRIS
jgi:hypothetical protein